MGYLFSNYVLMTFIKDLEGVDRYLMCAVFSAPRIVRFSVYAKTAGATRMFQQTRSKYIEFWVPH